MACQCGKFPKCVPPWEQVARRPKLHDLRWEDLTPCAIWKVPTWGQANAECWQNTSRVMANWSLYKDPGDLVVRTKWYQWACAVSCLVVRTPNADRTRAAVLRWQPFLLRPDQHRHLLQQPGRRSGVDTTITRRLTYPAGWPVSLTYPASFPGATPYVIRVGPWHGSGPVDARTAVAAVWPGAVIAAAVARYTAMFRHGEWRDPESITWRVRTLYTVQEEGALERSAPDRPIVLESESGHLHVHTVRLSRRRLSPIVEFVSEVAEPA